MVLPASMRLRGHRCFNHLHRRGKRFHSTLMVLRTVSASGAADFADWRRLLRGDATLLRMFELLRPVALGIEGLERESLSAEATGTADSKGTPDDSTMLCAPLSSVLI